MWVGRTDSFTQHPLPPLGAVQGPGPVMCTGEAKMNTSPYGYGAHTLVGEADELRISVLGHFFSPLDLSPL